MPSILLTFDTNPERERFIEELHILVDALAGEEGVNLQYKEEGWEERKEKGEFLKKAAKSLRRDPAIRGDDERRAAIFISGQQMVTGNVEQLSTRFQQECSIHSANVELREDTGDGKFSKVIRSRKHQAQ